MIVRPLNADRRRGSCVLGGLTLALGGFLAWAAPGLAQSGGNRSPVCAVTLADGSYLLGQPRQTAIEVQTDFATVRVPLANIVEIRFLPDREAVAVTLTNGDRLTGATALPAWELTALFGPVTIPRAHLDRIQFHGSAARRGLLLHYTFDDDPPGKVIDVTGHGNTGRARNVNLVEGHTGRAAQLSDEDSQIVVDEQSEFRRDVFTCCAWVKSSGPGRFSNCVMGKGNNNNGPSGRGFSLRSFCPESGTVRFRTYDGHRETDVVSRTSVSDGAWHFICGVSDGEQISVWVDGEKEGSTPFDRRISWDTSPLTIGQNSSAPSGYRDVFRGELDEVMVFDRALTAHQIKALMEPAGSLAPAGP